MSRKLSTVIAQITGTVAIVLVSAVIGGVDTEIQMVAIGAINAGGAINVLRQASIDKAQIAKVTEVEGLTEKVLGQVENLKAKLPEVL